MRKFTKERAEYILRKRMPETREVLAALPADVDPEVVADSALLSIGHTWSFARGFMKLPAGPVRAAMRRVQAQTTPLGIFLREAVPLDLDDDEITAAWASALAALLDMETSYAWGSKQRRAKLVGVARNPRFVAALQAVAVGCEAPPLDMLAVLTIDASDASIDALMPHFVRATGLKDGGLDRFRRLKTHASNSPGIRMMITEVEATFDARGAESPLLAIATRIGLGEPKVFWFAASFQSIGRDPELASIQADVSMDSRTNRFIVSLQEVLEQKITSIHASGVVRDDHGLGNCTPAEVPAYLARAAAALHLRWREPYIRGNMRGAARNRLRDWLLGGA